MIRARIAGTGRFLPSRVVTNDELAARMDTSDAWIRARTGVGERRWVEGDVGPAELAEHAARTALTNACRSLSDVDMVLFATLSPDVFFPGSGCLLQARLGLGNVPAMDLRNQCTGFLYGLQTADAFVRAGLYRCVLLVGAEVHSSGLDVSTRGRDVAVLFGDGAGAAVITPSDDVDTGILDVILHADGSGAELLMLEAPASRFNPRLTLSMLEEGRHYPRMDGPAVFRRAVERLPEVARAILARNGLTVDDVDLVVPHQANLRINAHVVQELGIPPEKVVHTVQRWGNTTAASIPTALDLAREDGRARPGSLVLMLAFGAGLTWGAALVRL